MMMMYAKSKNIKRNLRSAKRSNSFTININLGNIINPRFCNKDYREKRINLDY